MEATITKDGMLFITANNELESYALKRWLDEQHPYSLNCKLTVSAVINETHEKKEG